MHRRSMRVKYGDTFSKIENRCQFCTLLSCLSVHMCAGGGVDHGCDEIMGSKLLTNLTETVSIHRNHIYTIRDVIFTLIYIHILRGRPCIQTSGHMCCVKCERCRAPFTIYIYAYNLS